MKLHHKEFHIPNIIRVIISRKMGWVKHVVCMGKMRNVYILLVGKFEGKKLLGTDGKIILKWFLWK
jgi:hypothetical protein